MGVTGFIVLGLVVMGLLTLLIWLARALPMSASEVVLRVLVAPGLLALALWLAGSTRMGVTEAIVLALIGLGAAVIVVWFSYALASYPRVPATPTPAAVVERDLTHRSTPGKLSWNWAAFFLGPLWYLVHGLWVHTFILVTLVMLSAGILLPFVMFYGGFKANETLEDFRLAQHSVY